jgi:hypothetical protein
MAEWALVFAVLLIPMAVFVFAALGMRALGLLERIANALEFIAKSLTQDPTRIRTGGDVPADVRESVAYAFRALAEELER